MSSMIELWKAATGRSICHGRDCNECQRIYGHNSCPTDIKVPKEELERFVSNICRRLDHELTENAFDFECDMTEDEFYKILIETPY